ncbi:MAG TPA: hypothetical protein VLB73_04315 [Patescibacteria group bacterium]|jgi:hypothetical protein|nr:hypothetical protein [Patescibacteria group bacterium]
MTDSDGPLGREFREFDGQIRREIMKLEREMGLIGGEHDGESSGGRMKRKIREGLRDVGRRLGFGRNR